MSGDMPKHGAIKCEREGCSNKAYWKVADKYLCGVHSRKRTREALPQMTKQEKEDMLLRFIDEEKKDVERGQQENVRNGDVKLYRLLMLKAPVRFCKFRMVFPNFLHQNRKDGFGCARLSPKFMGPIHHGQPGLPPSLNLENFHQGSKAFAPEVDSEGKPNALFYKNREDFYRDPEPHRHKYVGEEKNKSIPRFFVWVDQEGREHYLSYVESRQFYCNFYERIAVQEPDFLTLQAWLQRGMNLQICGYDANPISGEGVDVTESIERAYLDPSKPFGHERVLFTMLTITENLWPWRKYKTFEF
jgi:hypothetical protein